MYMYTRKKMRVKDNYVTLDFEVVNINNKVHILLYVHMYMFFYYNNGSTVTQQHTLSCCTETAGTW